jgi:hypothetical protein
VEIMGDETQKDIDDEEFLYEMEYAEDEGFIECPICHGDYQDCNCIIK